MTTRHALLAVPAVAALALLAGCAQSQAAESDSGRAPAKPPLRVTSLCSAPVYVLEHAPAGLCDGSVPEPIPTSTLNDNDPRMLHGSPSGYAGAAVVTPGPPYSCSRFPGVVPLRHASMVPC